MLVLLVLPRFLHDNDDLDSARQITVRWELCSSMRSPFNLLVPNVIFATLCCTTSGYSCMDCS
jgi:hypothetical protein